ncbi:MAG: AI-2E family transporter [Porphyromonas sp.]|nr:AI-2E family transporter [Porphyromonas sp.]
MKQRQIETFLRKPFTFDRVARIGFTLLIFGAVVWLIARLSDFLIPFALAWLLAYLMMPVIRFLETRWKIRPRWVAASIVLLVTLGVVAGILSLLIPSITNEVNRGWKLLEEYNVGSYILSLLPESFSTKSQIVAKLQELANEFNVQELLTSIQQVFSKGWGIIESTFNVLSGTMVVFIFLFYLVFMLLDYEKVKRGAYKMLPRSCREFMKEFGEIVGYYFNAYFRSQAVIAMIVSVILMAGFSIINLPMGLTLGLIMGLLNMIPYLQSLGYLPLVVLVGLQSVVTGDNFFLLLIAGVAVIAFSDMLQSLVLVPLIQGQSLGIHPVAIMLSLTIWGSLFGFFGLFFALPLTMICYNLYMKYVVGVELPLNSQKGKIPKLKGLHKLHKKDEHPTDESAK